jgi:hypothetical protein
MGESDEVAKAAVFLASDDSSFVTGIGLFADGALVVVDFVMEAGAALFSAELAMHAFTGERIFLFAAPIRRHDHDAVLGGAGGRLCDHKPAHGLTFRALRAVVVGEDSRSHEAPSVHAEPIANP